MLNSDGKVAGKVIEEEEDLVTAFLAAAGNRKVILRVPKGVGNPRKGHPRGKSVGKGTSYLKKNLSG